MMNAEIDDDGVSAKIINMTNDAYHADKGSYSSSFVKKMDNAAQAKYDRDNPAKQKDCWRIGSAIHKFILEPQSMFDEFSVPISRSKRSGADKKEWADWFDAHGAKGKEITELYAKEWFVEFTRQTKINIVTQDELDEIVKMAEMVKSHKTAVKLLTKGKAEQSIFWADEATGLKLKVRPDYLNYEISDLKSIKSIDDKTIWNQVKNLGYDISEAMYKEGVMALTGEYRPFVFIFISKQPPYFVRCIELPVYMQEAAHNIYRDNLYKLAKCLDRNEWPGFSDGVEVLENPYYANKSDELDWG